MNKVKLLNRESSLEFLPNLSAKLGPKIYIKRDDQGGRGGGGNKLRKYERIIADALDKKADTLIIAGHYQSNAARELVGAACQLRIKSIVVCKSMIPEQNPTFNENGNALLMKLMNANIVAIDKEDDFQIEMERVAKDVVKNGHQPYLIPFGGSNLLGSLGYLDCANEIIEQFKNEEGKSPNYVITPTGSGGTMAGLVAGFAIAEKSTKVIGFSVLHKDQTIENIVTRLTDEIVNKIKPNSNLKINFELDTNFVGDEYGIPTEGGKKAIGMLAELEGIFLCPVYTSKAMAGLIDYIEKNKIQKEDTVVFIHTGGMPLVHAYYNQ
ncbi:D-cysteine desulfhydrase family protein [Winogradskyella sp. UBA3174]|uniref:D-cysteine desulfhydrase family protein n=1 Tax=Winogradskyella sp. UBA3174 TaxID=1947785 RepID=UPI0025EA4777|nr:D-cysteine desulfhydrase family protein [Winogradskyella sp. UBA3174]|tara:strand:- start:3084 stop:4055 length:972 start_codon:yes stop_codon:yes gene_type:complete